MLKRKIWSPQIMHHECEAEFPFSDSGSYIAECTVLWSFRTIEKRMLQDGQRSQCDINNPFIVKNYNICMRYLAK